MAMTTLAAEDVAQIWQAFKADPDNQDLRNRLVEMYLPLVKYNGERIWSRLPEGRRIGRPGFSRRLRPDGRD